MSKRKSKRIKAPNGAGNIIQRSDGRWMARWTELDESTGQRKRKALYARTEAELRAEYFKVRGDPQRGALSAGGPEPTLATYAEHWLSAISVRPKVKRGYADSLRLHILPTLGATKLTALESTHIHALMVSKRKAGKSARTANSIREILRNLLNDAAKETVNGRSKFGILRNAAADAKPIPTEATEREALDDEEARQLLDLAQTAPDGPLWTLALTTGLRQSELIGLRWPDLDLEDCAHASLHLVRGIQRHQDGTWLVQAPKSKKGTRTVPLTSLGCEALQRQRALQAAAKLVAGKRWKPVPLLNPETGKTTVFDDLVFTNLTGGPLSGVTVTKRFQAALKDAGMSTEVDFHGLRHSAGSILAALGVPPKVVQKILGHANISTTLNIYTHATEKAKRDAMSALNTALTR
jgi:integrase